MSIIVYVLVLVTFPYHAGFNPTIANLGAYRSERECRHAAVPWQGDDRSSPVCVRVVVGGVT